MTRAIRVPSQPAQELPDRSIVRDGIRNGHNGPEADHAILVAHHHATPVGSLPVGILHVVEALGVRLPHVHGHPGQRPPPGVLDGAHDQQRLPVLVGGNGSPGLDAVRILGVEGPEDGALGGPGKLGVVDGVDEQRQPQHVGQQDELLPHVGADGCDGQEELDGGFPLGDAEARLARKVVQVDDEALQEEAEAGVRAGRVDGVDVVRDVVRGEILHGWKI